MFGKRFSLKKTEPENLAGLYTDAPRSMPAKYPLVAAPDERLTASLLAARWVSHDLRPEEMAGIAMDLLVAGFDTPSMRRLAGETGLSSIADAEPVVGGMFRELGIDCPLSELEARWVVTRQIAREVIAGRRNVWAAASHLEIVVWGWVAEGNNLQDIFGVNDEIGWDAPYGRSVGELEAALFDAFARLAMK